MKKHLAAALGLLACISVLVSCANLFAPKQQAVAEASLHLIFSAPSARTLATGEATLLGLIASYSVRLSRQGFPDLTATADTKGELTMHNLAQGTWTVVVQALNGDGEIIATGYDENVTVSTGATATATISLQFDQASGIGEIELTVFFPKSVGIDSAVATLRGGVTVGVPVVVEEAEADETRIALASGLLATDYGKIDIARTGVKAGTPLLQLSLKTGGNEFAVMNETVRVLRNLPTIACRTLTVNDFGTAPTAPKNVAATYMQDGTIVVSWTGTSVVADGYTVERALSPAGPFTALSGTVDPSLRSRQDTDVSAGTAYYYRVAAVNRFGQSGWTTGSVSLTSMVFLGADDNYYEGSYWKGGKAYPLTAIGDNTSDGYNYKAIATLGEDVYVVGDNYNHALGMQYPGYWKNGAWTQLFLDKDNLYQGSATGVAVSGNDVYIVGTSFYSPDGTVTLPVFWRNGQLNYLPTNWDTISNTIQDLQVCVSGADVYVAGHYYYITEGSWERIVYWKNGVLYECTPANADGNYIRISGIAAIGNLFYIAGTSSSDVPIPVYWTSDGVKHELKWGYGTTGYSVTGIATDGNDLYFTGCIGNYSPGNSPNSENRPVYWKNDGVPVPLGLEGAMSGVATGIALSSGDVYISGNIMGYDGNMSSVYWKNGVMTVLDGSWIYSLGIAALGGTSISGNPGNGAQVTTTIDSSSIVPEVRIYGVPAQIDLNLFTSLTLNTNIRGADSWELYLDGVLMDGSSGEFINWSWTPGTFNGQYPVLTLVVTKNGLSFSGSFVFEDMTNIG